jgi:hypothetical protein
MNRLDLIAMKAYGEALTKAAAEALKADGRHEWEHNVSAVTWRVPGANASASISNTRLEVIEVQQFLSWLRSSGYADEVIQIFAPRNPEWLKRWLERAAKEVGAGKIEAPPGTKLEEGGQFKTVSVTVDGPVKRWLEERIRACLVMGSEPTGPRELWDTAVRETATPDEEE